VRLLGAACLVRVPKKLWPMSDLIGHSHQPLAMEG
jgi:hypothetical protein